MKNEASEKLTPVHVKLNRKTMDELQREMNRTGLTRSALLKAAWAEYVERRVAATKRQG